jgi:uncharacterized protein (DUF2141 family)
MEGQQRMMLAALLALAPGPTIASSPSLGIEEGRCRDKESGPAFLVNVDGLKDRSGLLKLEVYPANDRDFLADDNVLLMAGKTFRRVLAKVPKTGRAVMCVRVPEPGSYSLVLLHDRDANGRFNFTSDGVGFPGNPKLGWSKPKASAAQATARATPTAASILLNYRTGIASFGPVKKAAAE